MKLSSKSKELHRKRRSLESNWSKKFETSLLEKFILVNL